MLNGMSRLCPVLGIEYTHPTLGVQRRRLIEIGGRLRFVGEDRWYKRTERPMLTIGDKVVFSTKVKGVSSEYEGVIVDGRTTPANDKRYVEELWRVAAKAYCKRLGVPFEAEAWTHKQILAWDSAARAIFFVYKQRDPARIDPPK